ncbi:MAG: hypothetical protein KHF84_07540 [Thermoplasmata archaeon]|nr:hypothetical protein [Candidatus Sysuiplasma jiujiangense]
MEMYPVLFGILIASSFPGDDFVRGMKKPSARNLSLLRRTVRTDGQERDSDGHPSLDGG